MIQGKTLNVLSIGLVGVDVVADVLISILFACLASLSF